MRASSSISLSPVPPPLRTSLSAYDWPSVVSVSRRTLPKPPSPISSPSSYCGGMLGMIIDALLRRMGGALGEAAPAHAT